MKRLLLVMLCMALIAVLSACSGDGTSTDNTSAAKGVTFSINKSALAPARSTGKVLSAALPTTIDPTAKFALLSATDASGNAVLNDYKSDIYVLNGSYVTATVPLTAGSQYRLTKFLVLDSNNNILYLVPTEAAAADIKQLVTTVLPLQFDVGADETGTVTLQVLAPDNSTAQDFGYPSFSFNVVSYVRFMSTVQIQSSSPEVWQLTDANLTINSVAYHHPARTSTLRVAESTSYTLLFSKAGYETKTVILSAADIATYQTKPLVVVLSPSAPIVYPATFISNGGSSVPDQNVAQGALVVRPPDPAKAGYLFAGWYADADLTSPYDFNSPVAAGVTLYAKWMLASEQKMISWTGVNSVLIDGALRTSPYPVPAGRNTMTIRISGGAGGNSYDVLGKQAELRTFTGISISNSTYTIILGSAGGDGTSKTTGAIMSGGGGGGGSSIIKIGDTYVAGAAGGDGANGHQGDWGTNYLPGGLGGSGAVPGSDGEEGDPPDLSGTSARGGAGGYVPTGGLPVGGVVTGTGNGVLEITTH